MSYLPPASDSATAIRTRVKWDNIAIVLIGSVIAAFAVVAIVATADTAPTRQATKPAPIRDEQLTDTSSTDASADGELTLDDATSLADEAKTFLAQARWDEAADRLQTIPTAFRAAVDADAIEAQLTELRARDEQLRSELTAAVEARQWKEADVLLARLAKIAPLDAGLLETQAQVDAALAPAAKTEKDPAANSTRTPAKGSSTANASSTSTSGGGAGSSTQHQSTTTTRPSNTSRPNNTPRPTSTAPRPSNTTNTSNTSNTAPANGSSTTPATGNTQVDALLGQNLSQEELEAVLARYGVNSLDELAAL